MINKNMTLKNVEKILENVYEEKPLYVNEFFEEELEKILTTEYGVNADDVELVISDVIEADWEDYKTLDHLISKALTEGLITV